MLIDLNHSAECVATASELPLPKSVTNDNDGVPSFRCVFVSCEVAPKRRTNAENVEYIRGYDPTMDPLAVAFSRHQGRRVVRAGDIGEDPSKAGEGTIIGIRKRRRG